MSRKGGLDRFRIPAALLVIAIHTGPLGSFSETGDFFLTRVLGRVAVPFFFLVTGYFLGGKWNEGWPGIRSSWVKTARLYAGAVLLYLPLTVYRGDLGRERALWEALRDVAFNGTFYHLWYFPALLLGLPLALLLVRKLGERRALWAAGALYLVGVLGDSWYGLSVQIPLLKGLYDSLFVLFDYTRNGLFFAPLFLLLGSRLARRPALRPGAAAAGLALSFALMTGEAFWLRQMGWLRHDSMYLCLPAVVVCLFSLLAARKVRGGKGLARFALALYVIHPWSIVLIRGGARVLGLTEALVEQSLVFYLAVCLLSGGLSLLGLALIRRFAPPPPAAVPRRAWIEVDRDALRHNLRALQGAMEAGQRMMAVVKAEGYGHGAAPLARLLEDEGVDAFAVATLDEGKALRRAGIRGTILILGAVPAEAVPAVRRHRLTLTVADEVHAAELEAAGKRVHVHWKVDTGMHRLGVPWERLAETVVRCPHLTADGAYTHLCVSDQLDEESRAFTVLQLERFRQALDGLEQAGVRPREIHAQASYGLLNYTGLRCTLARVGIALYGVLSDSGPVCGRVELEPALSLRARIASVRTIGAGEGAGYGLTFRAKRETVLAAASIGYADGVPRSLSGRGHALVRGQRVPIAGRICMDQLLLDVTDVPGVRPGDTATLVGRDGEAFLPAEEAAEAAGTITNELLSRLGPRLERVYLGR